MEKLYPFREVADAWHCSVSMIKKLHSQRAFEVKKIGSKNYISESEINRFLDENTIAAY
jgi:hypothetical protein